MDTLKTVAVTAILMAVGYGVYVSLWQKPEQTASEKAPAASLPTVQLPVQGSSTPSLPSGSALAGSTNAAFPAPGSPPAGPGSPASLVPQAPLFAANSPGGNSSVTVIPGPNAATPPTTPPAVPAPASPPAANPPSATSPGEMPNPPGAAPDQDEFRTKYLAFIQQVQKTLDDGKLPEALSALTSFYELPTLPEPQKREVEQLLDQLAGTVIYSKQHYLERPYLVQQGDTLDQIAERCGVPAVLLARINGIDPQQLKPGQELKVLRGPFTAVISLDKHELALKLQGGYYAGRFPIGVGADCPKLEGTYTVREKTPRPIYHGPDGANISADDGRNPLGKYWIGLGDRIGLHGMIDESGIGRNDNRGTLCFKERDLDDLFGILSIGSQVVIRR
jgi:LysM repeat protein